MVHSHKKRSIKYVDIRPGSLLISSPVNSKYDNSKSLILITQHNEDGTTGIMLNKQLATHKILKRVYGSNEPVEVQYGGPDNLDLESYLIIYPSIKNGWQDSAFWSYDNLDIYTILHFLSEYNIRIGAFKGCIQWGHGELETELEDVQWWFTNDYQINSILNTGNYTWESLAKKYGGHYANLVAEDIPIIYN